MNQSQPQSKPPSLQRKLPRSRPSAFIYLLKPDGTLKSREEVDLLLLRFALSRWSISEAARQLGISRKTIQRKRQQIAQVAAQRSE